MKNKDWINCIIKAQEDDKKACEFLIKLALKWEVIESKNLSDNINKKGAQNA